jgi:hypothetical protein
MYNGNGTKNTSSSTKLENVVTQAVADKTDDASNNRPKSLARVESLLTAFSPGTSLYIYICICILLSICIYWYINIFIYAHICSYIYIIYVCTYIIYACTYTNVYKNSYLNLHIHI